MTIRQGGSPRDRGGVPGDGAAKHVPPAGTPGQPLPSSPDPGVPPADVPPTDAADVAPAAASAPLEPEVPEFLRGAGGSVREGGSLRERGSRGGATGTPPPAVPTSRAAAPSPRSAFGTRRPADASPPIPPPPIPPPRRPSGRSLWPIGLASVLGPLLAVVGLGIVAAVSLGLLNGRLPTFGGGGGGGGGNPGAVKTPTPSNVVEVDPRVDVPGTLVYVKDGNLWLQSGATARQLTSGGNDEMPAWSADGQWIYFIRTTAAIGIWPSNNGLGSYHLAIPALVRIHPDGTGLQTLLSGRIKRGTYLWESWIRQPFPSPDGTQVALVTDHPQPQNADVVLKILNLQSGALVNPKVAEVPPLGHQDPAWSPDGTSIAFVKDARSGTRGTPIIERYTVANQRVRAVTGPGYLSPAWSPDGRYLAATQTSSFGTDIVILDANTGAELLRLTNDGLSFDPVWSPAGDSIAFLRVDHGVVDLQLVKLTGSGPSWTIGDTIALTISAGLDSESRPSWYIPPDQLPTPGPTSAPTAVPFPTLHGPSQAPSATAP